MYNKYNKYFFYERFLVQYKTSNSTDKIKYFLPLFIIDVNKKIFFLLKINIGTM